MACLRQHRAIPVNLSRSSSQASQGGGCKVGGGAGAGACPAGGSPNQARPRGGSHVTCLVSRVTCLRCRMMSTFCHVMPPPDQGEGGGQQIQGAGQGAGKYKHPECV